MTAERDSPSRRGDEPLNRLERQVETLAAEHELATAQATWENTNRIGLLWVHAGIGALAGVLILSAGTATSLERIFGPAAAPLTGWVPLIGGLLLADGLRSKPRSVPLEVVGLFLLLGWDLALTAGFLIAYFTALGLPTSRPYPVAVYGGLAALICVHLWTLRKVLRVRREHDRRHGGA
ncbi:hypothetical protein [Nocardioides sp. ChNu-99]|uniref:hypothetical protein n=1 Tax=Nocardioides sp. ChNu-99 TaxID=2839897 RepID=UPI002405C044|nr:hypothetical protein [Nocardioides sp. ChNu-99]MDF9716037.1 hypothetical protein [Nocardioides sp. ChNu-99]